MAEPKGKTIWFLTAGNQAHGRLAQTLFNSVAGRMGLRWKAISHLLEQTTPSEAEQPDVLVILHQAEHRPLAQERFSAWTERMEFWHIDDGPQASARIEREVMALAARLIGGGQRQGVPEPEIEVEIPNAKPVIPRNAVVRVGRETKGRRGKGVTIVSDVPVDDAGLLDLAAKLKQRCGTGGTVKDGRIEIQGDQRERLVPVLEGLGFLVKRVGG